MENYPQLSFNYNVADKSVPNISVYIEFFPHRIEIRMNVMVSFYFKHDVVSINEKKLKTCQKKLDLTLFALFSMKKKRNSFDAM